jgi:hypothetical protein
LLGERSERRRSPRLSKLSLNPRGGETMPTSTDPVRLGSIIRSKITPVISAQVLSCGSSFLTSSTFDASGYRNAMVYISASDTGSTNAPSSIQILPQFATDSAGTYFNFLENIWASMTFSAVQIQSSTLYRAHTLPLLGRRLRFRAERDSTAQAEGENYTVNVSLETID